MQSATLDLIRTTPTARVLLYRRLIKRLKTQFECNLVGGLRPFRWFSTLCSSL